MFKLIKIKSYTKTINQARLNCIHEKKTFSLQQKINNLDESIHIVPS